MYIRGDDRSPDQLRHIKIIRHWQSVGEASVLVSFGKTKVLCTATFDSEIPKWSKGTGKGWVTSEYEMLPRATWQRTKRESRLGKVGGRTYEISRLIARSLRAAVNLKVLGENQIVIDCDVLQADGGTRCASITGAWVALKDSLIWAKKQSLISNVDEVLQNQIAAVSVGIVNQTAVLDLPYDEDSKAQTDMNVVMTKSGEFVEIQGTAEGATFNQAELNELLKLANKGCQELMKIQNASFNV
ncbi:MAG: ribonuclease PH [Bifidobacteriaceae bacterium]|jgi:ribonuclease PH|nr:ribonuclease PH [Bifidobacteriaceae bacterium]